MCLFLYQSRILIELSRVFDCPPTPLEFSCNWFFVFQALRCSRNPNFSFFTPSYRLIPIIRWSMNVSPVVQCPRNLTIAFRLIFRFATVDTENGGRLWNLCKQVEAMRQLLFASDVPIQLHPLFGIFKINRLLFCYFIDVYSSEKRSLFLYLSI